MKTMNSKESLALIEQMVQATRKKYETGAAGSIFLIWGYTSLIITALVYVLLYYYEIKWVAWLWFLIPVIGTVLSYIFNRGCEPGVRTHVDKFVEYLWIVIGTMAVLIPLSTIFTKQYDYVLPMEAIILSMGATITGLTVGLKSFTVGGALSMLIALAMFVGPFKQVIILFMVMFIVAMIIPGHILNCKKRCSKS